MGSEQLFVSTDCCLLSLGMELSLSSQQVLLLSRSLLASFISLLTLWYFLSPYLVASNAQFATDLNKMIEESSETNQDEDFLENWTKWRLFLSVGPANTVTVYPNSRLSLANLTFPLHGKFEWRPEYRVLISRQEEVEPGGLVVEVERPWYGLLGLYNHLDHQVAGRTVRLVPTFMFGLTGDLLDSLYGGPDKIPTRGMLTATTDSDRILVQCFMNLVVLTVIFLLWANNPVEKKVAVD